MKIVAVLKNHKFKIASLSILFGLSFYYIVRENADCLMFFPDDSQKVLDVVQAAGKTFRLALVTTGFQDRADFLEVFDEELSYTICGSLKSKPIFSEYIEPFNPEYPRYISGISKDSKGFSVGYTNDLKAAVPILNLKLKIK